LVTDDKIEKKERIYGALISKLAELCREVDQELHALDSKEQAEARG